MQQRLQAPCIPGAPDDAKSQALQSIEQNALATSDVVVRQVPGKPNRMYVSVTDDVQSVFGHFLGVDSLRIKRDAVGEYTAPMAMGSPSNVLGKEPGASDIWQNPSVAAMQSNYWLTIHGVQTPKVDGARWSAGSCDNGNSFCDRSLPAPQSNLEFEPEQKLLCGYRQTQWGRLPLKCTTPRTFIPACTAMQEQ